MFGCCRQMQACWRQRKGLTVRLSESADISISWEMLCGCVTFSNQPKGWFICMRRNCEQREMSSGMFRLSVRTLSPLLHTRIFAPHSQTNAVFCGSSAGLNAQISLSDLNPNKTLGSCINDDRAGRHSGSTSRLCATLSFFSCDPGARINQLTINYVGQCVAG